MVIDTSNIVDAIAIRNLSLVVSAILIVVYGLTLLFSLKTHSYLYDVGLADEEIDGTTSFPESEPSQNRSRSKLWLWIIVLLASTLAVAFESELFVGVIESQTQRFGLTPLFTGVILLPLISDVAGYVIVIRLALKNQMDLTVATATGDSLLVALFVAPVLGGVQKQLRIFDVEDSSVAWSSSSRKTTCSKQAVVGKTKSGWGFR
jgi:Ca2+:H+ antiporter